MHKATLASGLDLVFLEQKQHWQTLRIFLIHISTGLKHCPAMPPPSQETGLRLHLYLIWPALEEMTLPQEEEELCHFIEDSII